MQLARRLHGTLGAGLEGRHGGAGLRYSAKCAEIQPCSGAMQFGVQIPAELSPAMPNDARSAEARYQVGQLTHIVEDSDRPGRAQPVVVTRRAMAAAVKSEHGHPGGDSARDARRRCLR